MTVSHSLPIPYPGCLFGPYHRPCTSLGNLCAVLLCSRTRDHGIHCRLLQPWPHCDDHHAGAITHDSTTPFSPATRMASREASPPPGSCTPWPGARLLAGLEGHILVILPLMSLFLSALVNHVRQQLLFVSATP